MKIADADAHQMEPDDLWEKHIDARFRQRAPKMAGNGTKAWMVEGETLTLQTGHYKIGSPELRRKQQEVKDRCFKRLVEAGYAPRARLMDMDDHGVDIQIIYPTVGGQMLGREFQDLDLLQACCRAYNDWSAEYCSADPRRLRWAAMVPVQDVGMAVEEAERAARNGAVSIYVRPNPVCRRNLFDPENDRLWSVIEKLALPVSIHDSGSPRLPSYGSRMTNHTAGHILAHPFEAMGTMAGLIFGGVVERFPRLVFVHVEADAGWTPYWVQRMEQHWQYSGNAEAPDMKMSPTEYFKRNFYVACRSDERTLPAAVSLLGDENFVWNTDYPHPDGTWETGLEDMERQPLAADSKRRIMWDNAARAYHLD
jgi:predicted TIM-barrel fold metal-dependent hydrolase